MIMEKKYNTTQGLLTSYTHESNGSEYQTKTYKQKEVCVDTSGNILSAKNVDYKVSEVVNQKSISREEFKKINKLLRGNLKDS